MIDREPRVIRALERNANKGNLLSLAQLVHEHHRNNSNINEVELLEQAIYIIGESGFSLSRLKLENIKRLKKLELDFNKNLTVIIGENAVGKTTICESIAKYLSWASARIQKNKNGYYIRKEDISNGTSISSIIGQLSLNNNNFISYELRVAVGADQESVYEEINLISYVIRWVLENAPERIELPFFAYYSVDRVFKLNKKSEASFDYIRTEAYEHALKEFTDISSLQDWYIRLDNLSKKEKTGTYDKKIEILPDIIDEVSKIQNKLVHSTETTEQDKMIAEIRLLLESLENTSSSLEKPQADRMIFNTNLMKEVLNQTIRKFINTFKNFKVGIDSFGNPELLLDFSDHTVGFNQLSHGQRSVINMIFDLVRRLSILNPQMKDPRLGKGVVIIDEIELHLHPSWQQNIINNLCECFPNIQFIITTHSPMVLQSKFVSIDNLRVLKEREGHIIAANAFAQGKSVDDILLDVFQVSKSKQENIDLKLKKLYELIANGLFSSDEGQELYLSLKNRYGTRSNVVKEIESALEVYRLLND